MIVEAPKSANIIQNRTSVLSCTAVGQFINWLVNNRSIDSELNARGFESSTTVIVNSSLNLRERNLSVLGSTENNGSVVTCVAVIISPQSTATSEPVEVTVRHQGIIDDNNVVHSSCEYFWLGVHHVYSNIW